MQHVVGARRSRPDASTRRRLGGGDESSVHRLVRTNPACSSTTPSAPRVVDPVWAELRSPGQAASWIAVVVRGLVDPSALRRSVPRETERCRPLARENRRASYHAAADWRSRLRLTSSTPSAAGGCSVPRGTEASSPCLIPRRIKPSAHRRRERGPRPRKTRCVYSVVRDAWTGRPRRWLTHRRERSALPKHLRQTRLVSSHPGLVVRRVRRASGVEAQVRPHR